MIEVPKDNERRLYIRKLVTLAGKTFGLQSITACRLYKVRCLAAISRHTAFTPKFGKRHKAFIKPKHCGKRGSATLDRLQLKNRRGSRSFGTDHFKDEN